MLPFDPSKMDPKTLMKLSELVRQLPPEQISRMQTLMHNMMAGFDVKRELDELEKALPANFRETLLSIMGPTLQTPAHAEPEEQALPASLHDARLTILRAVQSGAVSPEEAETLLFPDH